MANGIFFVSWELWQQMTFVLAMGIVAVFCAGLIKLWFNNRLMRKQEILDQEKRARYTEMRKSGLSVKRTNDIPFGVRAIQSGVEVPGIWISRPATPEEVAVAKQDPKDVQVTTVRLEKTAPKRSPSDGSILQRLTDAESSESTPVGTPPVSKFASSQSKKPSYRGPNVLNEDTLRRLEGQAPQSKPAYDTYIPTSSPRNQPRQPSQRSTASSSGESSDSQPTRSPRSTSGRSYTSSRSSRLYTARGNMQDSRTGYQSAPQQTSWTTERSPRDRDPYDSSARMPTGMTAFPGPLAMHQEPTMPMPEPTFGPGDLHANRSSRRVNNGFEVLPAGTFGQLPTGFEYNHRGAPRG
ncbi:hypothetical protein QBC37DRAFT_437020 [Rhypophila decipiens]|uniref:Uncharacterized protein n=1 Tax=Rhypophila decipiens TaxID=261697 RepID=A0AAN7BEZ3_9PEZI|nr:hypothetical protein QBC37DRAFT_437020 [Rhypophila decipiens]